MLKLSELQCFVRVTVKTFVIRMLVCLSRYCRYNYNIRKVNSYRYIYFYVKHKMALKYLNFHTK